MGKDWDHHKGGRTEWIAWMRDVMAECLRVLKPGAHGLVWALPRTSHWTGTALEEAGFEVRDTVLHCFGSGFPKSLDVSKAIDKAAGASRANLGISPAARANARGHAVVARGDFSGKAYITAPATPDAKRWQGFGTALKPAVEIWWLVRKPLSEKTVARNVLKHGVGALNIDASRIGTPEDTRRNARGGDNGLGGTATFKIRERRAQDKQQPSGRFPANLVLSHHPACEERICVPECTVAELDRQSGTLKSGQLNEGHRQGKSQMNSGGGQIGRNYGGDSGGASRFFYVAKPSRRERNLGCEGLPKKQVYGDKGGTYQGLSNSNRPSGNGHPTVKPLKLMRYLITMITPPGGTCLDPFLGSGTTAVAAKQAGFRFIGIERERDYVKICRARVRAVRPAKRPARPLQEVSA